MDWSGAFFSLMAVVTQTTFDVLGGVMYIICALLELGIFSSQLIWLARTRRLRKQLKEEGKTFDELVKEYKERGEEWEWTERELKGDLLGLQKLKVWLGWGNKEGGREDEESEGGAEQRDLEKQEEKDAVTVTTAGGQQQSQGSNSETMASEVQKENGSEDENTGASTPTMVDGANGEVDRT